MQWGGLPKFSWDQLSPRLPPQTTLSRKWNRRLTPLTHKTREENWVRLERQEVKELTARGSWQKYFVASGCGLMVLGERRQGCMVPLQTQDERLSLMTHVPQAEAGALVMKAIGSGPFTFIVCKRKSRGQCYHRKIVTSRTDSDIFISGCCLFFQSKATH